MRVVVIMGGSSSEREISLKTGRQISDAIALKGHRVFICDIDEHLTSRLQELQPDVAFIALHGRLGEDGCIQGLLQVLGIPYVGSGVLASALAMNKIMTKKILRGEGILTPAWVEVSNSELESPQGRQKWIRSIVDTLGLPVVVKPNQEGSSVGITIPENIDELDVSLKTAARYDATILVEQFIKGTEVTVGVLGNDDLCALPIIEITTKTKFYDYNTKYTKGLSDHIIPARIDTDTYRRAQETGIQVHKALGCRGLSRVDAIISQEMIYVLEVNTIPGMTELSLFPDAARYMGLEFPDLIQTLIDLALEK